MASVTVYNFNDFRTALTTDPTIDTIYLGADIVASGSIPVLRTKGSILIDGIDPNDPSRTIHSYTDPNSSTDTQSVHLMGGSEPFTSVTMQNLIVYGRNWYGMFFIQNVTTNVDVVLNIKNVTYTGPQAIHHRSGHVHITDSSFVIDRLNGTVCSSGEISESNSLTLEGEISILTYDTGDSCFWLYGSNTIFTVKENAVITIDAPETYVFYCDAAPAAMVFESGSDTKINCKSGCFPSASANVHMATSILIDSNASVKIWQSTRRSGVGTLRCRDSLTVNENASLEIYATFSPSDALIDFPRAAVASFNNPQSVVLYNYGSKVINPSASLTLNINAELINRWTTARPLASAGGMDDIPTAYFRKADGTNITATATTSSTSMQSVNSDNTLDDIGGVMTVSNFNIFDARILSFGRIPLELEEINDATSVVLGSTLPLANVRLIYEQQAFNGEASASGEIALEIEPMPVSSTGEFYVNSPFFIKSIDFLVEGSLRLTHFPERIDFERTAVPARQQLVKRSTSNVYLEITDTRIGGGNWYLYAHLDSQMHSDSETIENALVFKNSRGQEPFDNTNVLIYASENPAFSTVTTITWAELEGILLQLIPNREYSGGIYNGAISWNLYPAPIN